MKKIVFGTLILALAIIVACKKPGCLIAEKAAGVLAGETAKVLQPCAHPELILEDYNAFLDHVGICAAPGVSEMVDPKTGVIADLVCPYVSQYAVEFLAKEGVPAKWGCEATDAKAKLTLLLTVGCKKLPF